MKIRNFTPHVVRIFNKDFETIMTIQPEKAVIRVLKEVTPDGFLNGVPVVCKSYGEIEGLPAPERDTYLIVSIVVLTAANDRTDLICPDTGPESVVRDEKGNILGVKRFQR